jgi:Kef-type K+ transport system membrane component KefB
MSDHDLVVFLLALAVLLGAARLLGELGRVWGLPLVAGEIAAGILLGPTVFFASRPARTRGCSRPAPARR